VRCRPHPQSNPVKTPADFDAARTKAEAGLTHSRAVLTTNRKLPNQADDDTDSLNRYAATRETDASAVKVLTNIEAVLQDLLGGTAGKLSDQLAAGTTNPATQETNLQTLRDALKTLQDDTADFNALSEGAAQPLRANVRRLRHSSWTARAA
jgi:hypothetical protein